MQGTINQTFAAFKSRNFRLFFIGQGISSIGSWAQTIGMSWLVLSLTHSGTQLGLVLAAQFVPMMILGVWGGLIADSFPKRRTIFITQSLIGLLALTLGLLVVTHSIHLWMIYVLAVMTGLVQVADNPTRQSFIVEMVGPEHLRNALTLNSTLVNTARIVGPTIAAALIATVGIGLCFLFNAASFVAVLMALWLMNPHLLAPAKRATRERGQIRAGLAYAWTNPVIRSTIIMMFIIGTLTYEFPVVLPLLATATLHGNAATYSAMMSAMGLGAILGGLYTAGRTKIHDRQLIYTVAIFGVAIIIASLMPNLISVLIVLTIVGALSVLFISLGNTLVQLASDPEMRGRVMALWTIGFLGTTPIGGPIIGYISDRTNPRVGLAVGGVAAIVAAIVGLASFNAKPASSPRAVPAKII